MAAAKTTIPRADLKAPRPKSELFVAWALRACAFLSVATTIGKEMFGN